MGILFDMDGVIADTNPFHKLTIQQFCKQHGIATTDAFLEQKVFGRVNKEWIPELFGDISEEESKRLADEKEQLFRDVYKAHLVAVDGLLAFLTLLKENNIKAAVATSAPLENADFILEGLQISHFFDAVLHSADVDQGKPHPEIYLKAANALGLAPKQCIVIEDSVSGVVAGKAAGCKVIGITTTHSREELGDIDLGIDDFVGLRMEDLVKL